MQRFRSYVPVGILLPLFVLALATLGAAGAFTAAGASSNAFAQEIGPCEEGSKAQFAPGDILVKMAPGADIGAILEEEGEPPDAAELVVDEDFGLYVVSVPEGEELAKCRAYAMHPEVLIVEPNFIRTPHDPAPTPDRLPSGGGPPERGPTPAVFLLITGAALLVVSAAVVFSQRPGITRPDNSKGGN